MSGLKTKKTQDIGGGRRITTVRRSPGGPRSRVGYPPDAVLAHAAPAADKHYLRQLLARAQERLAENLDDDEGQVAPVDITLAYIGRDGTMITAHNGKGRITVFARDIYTGRVRAVPLLDDRAPGRLRVAMHNLYGKDSEISRSDELFLCVETGNAYASMDPDRRARLLGSFLAGLEEGEDETERAAQYMVGLAERAGTEGHISLTVTRIEPVRPSSLIVALFEGRRAEARRTAASMVPVMTGILQRDIVIRQRSASLHSRL